ncbi:MAG: PSD1 domain-containing protein [Verrucomicrobiales bacterium]|nr:PSD1 domain-containing protein [Verrucomicrobiales bacterium]
MKTPRLFFPLPHLAILASAWIGGISPYADAAPPARGLDLTALPDPLNRRIQYFGDVHPILAEHCIDCHGPDKQKGGLRLDSRIAALEGGESYGPAIVPGKSAESPLIQFMAHLEPDMEMPPNEDMRPTREIATLRAWIDQGAAWPMPQGQTAPSDATASRLGNQELFFQEAKDHWAYQAIPSFASRGDTDVPAGVDRRIRAQLEEAGLTPSPAADARTLIRRLHYDLTGLPPTADEVAAFATAYARNADAATTAVVDRLLASPHFGERWGRYWLDLARYADSRDFIAQADLRYPYAWTYRDYVVSAFNTDKPYNRFLEEQLAADQLDLPANDPALAALGFITVGPRFRNRTDEIINDRIDVVTRGLMATTVACARCHDHKFDPIRTEDFYALYGVFASTQDLDTLPEIQLPSAEPPADLRKDYEAKLSREKAALQSFLIGLKTKAVADIRAKPALYFDALRQMEVDRTADVRKLITGGKMTETALTPLGLAWTDLHRNPKWQQDPALGPLARIATASPEQKPRLIDIILKTGRVPGGTAQPSPLILAAMKKSPPKNDADMLKLYGQVFAQAAQAADPASKAFVQAFTGKGGWLDFDLKQVESAHRLLGKGRAELSDLYEAITEVDATHPGAPPRAMAVTDRAKPIEPVVFVRGDPQKKGDPVKRRFLEVLDPARKPFDADASGRLELAQDLVDRSNPLTGRVWANQIWRHLFGTGLVATTGDFGLQVPEPLHRELLDYLAAALMDRGWSTKHLIRDIVLSKTYRQSSLDRPDQAAKDVLNNHFWRANRRRMDFEAMRDGMLAASGKLDLTLGGRAVNLSTEPFSTRRTIYGYVDRTNLDPLFTTFDFPSPDIASTQRSETLVPQQALFALNDGFIIDLARSLAHGAQDTAGTPADSSGAIDWLYRTVFFRPPTEAESVLASSFLNEAKLQSNRNLLGSWVCGYGSADPASSGKDRFKRLSYFDPKTRRYQMARVFPHPRLGHVSLSASGGHPGRDLATAAVRRWIAPYDAEIEIQGELSVTRQGSGDGVRGRLLSSRSGQIGEWISDGGPVQTPIASYQVKRGETLDFAVDCRESNTSDGFRWIPSIRLRIQPEQAPTGVQTVWDAQADYAPPPPPPLQPLEQLAHALLMTNEFLFID